MVGVELIRRKKSSQLRRDDRIDRAQGGSSSRTMKTVWASLPRARRNWRSTGVELWHDVPFPHLIIGKSPHAAEDDKQLCYHIKTTEKCTPQSAVHILTLSCLMHPSRARNRACPSAQSSSRLVLQSCASPCMASGEARCACLPRRGGRGFRKLRRVSVCRLTTWPGLRRAS